MQFFIPDESVPSILLFVAVCWFVYVFLRVLYMIWRLMHKLWTPTVVAPAPPQNPNNQRILIVGDSTARGTGATRSEDSIAGRLRKDFPRVEIVNNSVDGARTGEVAAQLQRTAKETFDLVFVATGGNDIWLLTSRESLRKSLTMVLTEAIRVSNHRAILLFYANFGSAPIFPASIAWYLRRRTKMVHDIFLEVCTTLKVPCIELYTEFAEASSIDTDYFSQDPKYYFAKDYMHPSGEGYGLWYRRIWREMVENDYASGLGDPPAPVHPK